MTKKQQVNVNKNSLPLVAAISLILGVIGIICSTYIQDHKYWSDTNYNVGDCRVQAPTDPSQTVRGNKLIPQFTGCTGVKVGWPVAFAKSDVEVSIGVNNPKIPVTIGELFGFSNIFLSIWSFLIDWLIWSIVGFCLISAIIWSRDVTK